MTQDVDKTFLNVLEQSCVHLWVYMEEKENIVKY